MSNEIYGYLEAANYIDPLKLAALLEKKTGLGITSIPIVELYGFPKKLIPSKNKDVFCFLVSDEAGKTNATYLIDNLDYAQEAYIKLPLLGKDRLELLVNAFIVMIKETKATYFAVALTDSSQIEEVKTIKLSELRDTIISDCNAFSPPDYLYEVTL